MTLHLIKLAVGPSSVADLQARQSRLAPLRHLTRQMPKRAAEIVAGGSLYWVVAGLLAVRQRVTAIEPAQRPDGTACATILLDPALVLVRGRAMRPFQGWRYLRETDAPEDVQAGSAGGELPEAMRRDLAALALL